jgi:hypothetical protein
MDDPHGQALQAVAADEKAARIDDPPYLVQQFVLQVTRRHVMQHGEANGTQKPAVGKWHRCRVSGDDFHVAATEARAQRLRQLGINLDGGKALHLQTQQIGCEPGPRAPVPARRPPKPTELAAVQFFATGGNRTTSGADDSRILLSCAPAEFHTEESLGIARFARFRYCDK